MNGLDWMWCFLYNKPINYAFNGFTLSWLVEGLSVKFSFLCLFFCLCVLVAPLLGNWDWQVAEVPSWI